MERMARKVGLFLVSGIAVLLAACGGGSGGNGGGGNQPTTPSVTVTPAIAGISTSASLPVTVTVAGTPTPTGSVILTSGTYASSAATLSAGSASITIPAGKLAVGSASIKANYTPDSASSSSYTSATGTATVSVARTTPTVTVTPASSSIDTSQSLKVTIAVAGPGTGAPVVTGTVTLTSGSYSSSATALSSGSASITIPAGQLPAGNDALTATYAADSTGSAFYAAATGVGSISVVILSTVTVNQSTVIAPATDQLLGINLESWYDVVGNATAIDAAFGSAGIKAIRWPGGSWSDAYHWNSTGLPMLCDTTTTGILGWGGYSKFSDFMAAIPQAGGFDLAMTANYGSDQTCTKGGDPTEAAAWAAEAVTLGYPPSHITVGNENYGSWEYDLHTKKNDPTTYANSVIGANGYYKLIQAASPTTKIGVVVDAGSTQPGWDSTVLSLAKGSFDFVEYHYYPQWTTVTSDTYLVHQAALDFTTDINTLKSELTTAGVENTPIYVGEVGGNSGNPGTQSWSITQGLYAGQLLGEAMNDGVVRLTWWDGFGNCFGPGNNGASLYGWQAWGAQNVFSDGPSDTTCPNAGPIGTLSPTAQAFNLFKNVAVNGESALSTAFSGDQNNVRVYAATHSGGTALFLLNLNENQSQPVTITLSKQSSSSDVTVMTYNKEIYDYTDPTCKTDPTCTYDPTHDYTNAVWAPPTTTDLGAQNLPLTVTLTPWSMNVVIIK